jgi:endoglucanase
MKKIIFILFLNVCVLWSAHPDSVSVLYNQVGYYPGASKILLLKKTGEYHLLSIPQQNQVFSGQCKELKLWEPSGQKVCSFDFSDLQTPGRYFLTPKGQKVIPGTSPLIQIGDQVHKPILRNALRAFYYNRAATDLAPRHAGIFHRKAGKYDHFGSLHKSVINDSIHSPQVINTLKGWYDAGDFGRYVLNSNITMLTLMSLYEDFPEPVKSLKLNIPESNNKISDFLDEMRWNLEWMLIMQDSSDGGVYHKQTSERFEGSILPQNQTMERYLFAKSTPATMGFAAVMAKASQIYRPFDSLFANSCLKASQKAWEWGNKNPDIKFENPPGVQTGQYGFLGFDDEIQVASVYLYLVTQNQKYLQKAKEFPFKAGAPWWGDLSAFSVYSIVSAPDNSIPDSLKQSVIAAFLKSADEMVLKGDSSSFGVAMGLTDFHWGSNHTFANHGMHLLKAYRLNPKPQYLKHAVSNLDYILGKNPFNLSFITGAGKSFAKDPHHRQMEADGISDPIPGFLVGGAHDGGQDVGPEAWKCKEYRTIGKPALGYIDHKCSYASNEVAINWQAAVVYLLGALESVYQPDPRP